MASKITRCAIAHVYIQKLVIAFDFDGTLHNGVWGSFLEIDDEYIEIIKELQALGCHIIIFTCRENLKSAPSNEMVEYDKKDVIKMLADYNIKAKVNENICEPFADLIDENDLSKCRKVTADLYVDDRSICYDRELAVAMLRSLIEAIKENQKVFMCRKLTRNVKKVWED